MKKDWLEEVLEVLLAEPLEKPVSDSEEDVSAYLTGTCGYLDVKVISPELWVAICPFIYTQAIIVGTVAEASYGYSDRWCYHTYEQARLALESWEALDYVDEPIGWHRHPDSGRRRDEDGREYIQP